MRRLVVLRPLFRTCTRLKSTSSSKRKLDPEAYELSPEEIFMRRLAEMDDSDISASSDDEDFEFRQQKFSKEQISDMKLSALMMNEVKIHWKTNDVRLSQLTDKQLSDLSTIGKYLTVVPRKTALGLYPVSVLTYDWKKIGVPEYITMIHTEQGNPEELFDILQRYLENGEMMVLRVSEKDALAEDKNQKNDSDEEEEEEEEESEVEEDEVEEDAEEEEEQDDDDDDSDDESEEEEQMEENSQVDNSDDDDSDYYASTNAKKSSSDSEQGVSLNIGLVVRGNRRDEIIEILDQIYDPSNYILMDHNRFGYAFDMDPRLHGTDEEDDLRLHDDTDGEEN
jgi:hypothetical protein